MNFSTHFNIGKCQLRGIVSFVSEGQEYFVTIDRIGFIYVLHRKDGHNLSVYNKFKGHLCSISSICAINSWKGDQIIITGSLDQHAKFWKATDMLITDKRPTPIFQFAAGDNICRIKELSKGEICLSSWNGKSTILFEDGRENVVLIHESFYDWDVLKTNNFYITADASQSVSIFDHNGTLINKLEHVAPSPLRIIFQYQDNIYVASNSGNLYELTFKDKTLEKKREYKITDEGLFAYCIESNKLFIGGDDKVVFVFDLDKFTTIDVLPVLGCIWGCLLSKQTSDIFISTESGSVFIFTKDLSRKADEEETENFLEELQSVVIPIQSVGSSDVEDYPTKVDDEIAKPGFFFAIQNNGEIEIVIHSSCFGKYVCVGKVDLGKKTIGPDNKKYDTSITIIGEDDSTHELYLNYKDDPVEVATRFCHENNLEDRFIDQIVDFINLNLGDKAKKSKKVKSESGGKFDTVAFGVAEMQGRRPYMEDFNTVFQLSDGKNVFCVFDGHGGDQAAIYAKENIKEELEKNIQSESFIADSLIQMNEIMVNQFQDRGSTAVVCCYSPKDHRLFTSNLGDSRAIICRKEKPIQLTTDHKVSEKSERELIEKNGGVVTNERVSGLINLSRTLGDGIVSKFMCKEPFSSTLELNKGDRVLIGCDGIFDFLSNEELNEIVLKSENPEKAAIEVRDHAFNTGSADNLTVIVFEVLE